MPPKKRKPENIGLPRRWSYRRGAYYYAVPPGLEVEWDNKKLFRLGKTQVEAYKIWADRLELRKDAKTMDDLFDRYIIDVLPSKAPGSMPISHAPNCDLSQKAGNGIGRQGKHLLMPLRSAGLF